MKRIVFPFSAVMGQENVKKALIWNYINPRIGGVLISGQKGTAKSTLVRASASISGKRIVELPLNITEDRLIGAIDFEKAIRYGYKSLDKGILYAANKNILYADEINLLSENIVKALLEAAADGICRVEREGISEVYDCDFILIGSMNPEESGLRPQLLDRFGLYVDVAAEENPLVRCEIMRRRIAFEQDPEAFLKEYESEDLAISTAIQNARKRLPEIEVSENARKMAAELSASAHCQGCRGEIVIVETARAICALKGYGTVNREALVEAAKFALPHRMRDAVPQELQEENREPEKSKEEEPQERSEPMEKEEDSPEEAQQERKEEPENTVGENQGTDKQPEERETPNASSDQEQTEECGQQFQVCRWLENDNNRLKVHRGTGRRSLVKTSMLQGRYVKSRIGEGSDIAFDATLRAAAPYQKSREKNGLAFAVKKCDFRQKIREKRTGNFLVFVVDASGSMGAGKRMKAVKGAILSLLGDAYQKRDKVAMITFRKDSAQLVLGMTRSIDLAAKKLETLSTGGKTPLYAGLEAAHKLVTAAKRRDKELMPVIILVSDGRATCGKGKDAFADAVAAARAIAADKIKTVVIDVEQDFIRLRLAKKLAGELDAQIYQLSDLHAGAILSAVKLAMCE